MSKSYKKVGMTKYFDSFKVDIKSDLDGWDSVKKELYKLKPQKR